MSVHHRTNALPGRSASSLAPLTVAIACALAAAATPLALMMPLRALGVMVIVGALVLAIARRPVIGAYLLLAVTPLIAGLERGGAIPLLRPNEALLALVLTALAARGLFELLSGTPIGVRLRVFEWWLLAFAVSGSLLPLLWMFARGRDITQDDVLYAGYLWKYAAVYLVIRVTVRTERALRRCLWISLAASAVVGIVAILHVLGVEAVHDTLAGWYASDDVGEFTSDRGTSTLGSSFAVADVMIFSTALATAWAVYEPRLSWVLVPLAVLFLCGTFASGQISAPIGLAAAAVTVGVLTRYLGRILLVGTTVALIAGLALAPVVRQRIEDFDSAAGVPGSWVGRWENLTTFFWPPLATDLNWLTGYQVAGRVAAPERWRDWVFVESGYTWMLWSGGIVFLVVGCLFLAAGIRATAAVARMRRDAVGAAAVAAASALWLNVVLMVIDVHLTLRGSGDLLFALLALALCGVGEARSGRLRKRDDAALVSPAPAEQLVRDAQRGRTPPAG